MSLDLLLVNLTIGAAVGYLAVRWLNKRKKRKDAEEARRRGEACDSEFGSCDGCSGCDGGPHAGPTGTRPPHKD